MPAGIVGDGGLRRELIGAVVSRRRGLRGRAGGGIHAHAAPASPKTVYLQVGVGSFTANYNAGGQPGNNTTVNTVSTTVAAARWAMARRRR